MRRIRPYAVAVIALVALVAAGCGSSNKKLSYNDFVAKMNSLCNQGNTAVKSATGNDAKVSAAEDYIKKFEKVKPPDELKPAHDQFLSTIKASIEDIKNKDLAKYKVDNAKSNVAASKMGAKDCVTPSS